jgi:hypothetical protein
MKRKVKRYDEGGGVEEMKKGLFAPKEDKEQEDSRSTYFKSPSSTRSGLPSAKEKTGTYGPSSSDEPASFKQAFAAARKAGDSSFSFDGKKFSTDLAGGSKKSSAMENAAKSAKMGVMPTKSKFQMYNDAADAARKDATGDSFKREKVSEADSRSSPSVMADKPSTTNKRQGVIQYESGRSLSDWSKNLGKKAGGAVKKMSSGGSTASRRADGCAMRGKTRGKMV